MKNLLHVLLTLALVVSMLFTAAPGVAAEEASPEEGKVEAEEAAEGAAPSAPELKNLAWLLEQEATDSEGAESDPNTQWESLEKLIQNVDALGQIMQPQLEEVTGFSPLSLYMALMALRPGLSEEGQAAFDAKLNPAGMTEEELQQALAFMAEMAVRYGENEEEIRIWESNTLAIGDQSFEFHPEYLQGLEALGLGAMQGDLTSAQAFKDINALIAYYTQGLIDPLYSEEDIQEQIKNDIVNLLINTLYFNDAWAEEFDEAATTEQTFYGQSGESQVAMMQGESEEMLYLDTEDYTAVRKPYLHGADMLILMPKHEVNREEFWSLYEEAKNSENWDLAKVTLTMPKWEQSSKISLDKTLEVLGLNAVLQEDPALRFFTDQELPLELGSSFQRVELKVNEKGTEAAVATVIAIERASMPIERLEVEVVIDHPFIYAVSDYGLNILQGLIYDLP
ncbi:MAG: serpin family protein [Eubacteriales bacterium]|nr:serpin family protein [Eubacteriales bacterium]